MTERRSTARGSGRLTPPAHGGRKPPKRRAKGKAAPPRPDSSAATADMGRITHSGLLMSKLEELVQRAPAVDRDRVAAIKDAIASGTYEIDDQRIADRLLKFAVFLVEPSRCE